jgi:predicted hotdog family 3-hydroxylacyl-ACP dehydratase
VTALTDTSPLYDRLPHAGKMRLIDEVIDWNADGIRCRTRSHRDLDNPLRSGDGLPAVHGIEYGAQAAALHGVLTGAIDDGPGLMLGAVRDLHLLVDSLDAITEPLTLTARVELRSGVNAIYSIAVAGADQRCIEGRLTLLRAREGAP